MTTKSNPRVDLVKLIRKSGRIGLTDAYALADTLIADGWVKLEALRDKALDDRDRLSVAKVGRSRLNLVAAWLIEQIEELHNQ